MSAIKQYESLDEIRQGLKFEAEMAADDFLRHVLAHRGQEHPSDLKFTVSITPEVAEQARALNHR